MTTINTERRLAVTPGTWKVRGRYDVYAAVGTYIGTTRANNPEEMPENFRAIDEANAKLIADAGTTANACDMLPSELLVKLREAEKEVFQWRGIADGPTARRQFPDGTVPGNSEDAARGWMDIATKLRAERDDLVGALEEIRRIPLFANSDAEHVFAVQRIAREAIAKHKPE